MTDAAAVAEARAPQSTRLVAEVPELDLHLDFAAAHFGDPAVARWHWPDHLGGPRSREQVALMLAEQAAQWALTGFAFWWWRERESGELIGMTGLNRADVAGEPVIEVGWSISPVRQRSGYATEAAVASIAWGFERCHPTRIVSFTLPDNVASSGVMRAAGMQRRGNFDRKGFEHVLYEARAASWRASPR